MAMQEPLTLHELPERAMSTYAASLESEDFPIEMDLLPSRSPRQDLGRLVALLFVSSLEGFNALP